MSNDMRAFLLSFIPIVVLVPILFVLGGDTVNFPDFAALFLTGTGAVLGMWCVITYAFTYWRVRREISWGGAFLVAFICAGLSAVLMWVFVWMMFGLALMIAGKQMSQ